MKQFNHEEIAHQRELVANQLTDMGIYRSVVENILSLDCDDDYKVELLFEAVPDLAIIIAQLSLCKSRGIITYNEYATLSNQCLLKINKDRTPINFNPTYLNGSLEDM